MMLHASRAHRLREESRNLRLSESVTRRSRPTNATPVGSESVRAVGGPLTPVCPSSAAVALQPRAGDAAATG